MNSKYGFVRIVACSPRVAVGNPDKNVEYVHDMLVANTSIAVADIYLFPELNITGYTCADLFGQERLLRKALSATHRMAMEVGKRLVVVGLPFVFRSNLYNCAAVLNNGKIIGIVPKQFLPTYKEFYEKRWFQSGEALENTFVDVYGDQIPFGPNLLFEHRDLGTRYVTVGIEICEDLWMPIPPSCYHTIAGANIILNLSASNETIGKSEYRTDLVKNQSGRCVCAYAYASSGPEESTTDLVFGGHCLIAENSHIVAESSRVGKGNALQSHIVYDVDYEKLDHERRVATSFGDAKTCIPDHHVIPFELVDFETPQSIRRSVPKHPFVPSDPKTLHDRCEEIFGIQKMGLVRRLQQIPDSSMINIGISGGLDSTLALLVAIKACDKLQWDRKRIRGITMPGFGTDSETLENATKLMSLLGITQETIDIKPMCLQVFNDTGHCPRGIGSDAEDPDAPLTMEQLKEGLANLEPGRQDLVFENVQARVRTLILMSSGFVLGTGDMSELALGWCTYNGDHMSMYNVNCSIPKTLVKFLVEYMANNEKSFNYFTKETLLSIAAQVITAGLLPLGKDGEIVQSTEDTLGPYELHDFFLNHFIRNGSSPSKIYFLACHAFKDDYKPGFIRKTLETFFWRFFANQFKRSCVPDGPKVGSVSLSPRGDWRMPSDADVNMWLKEVKEL